MIDEGLYIRLFLFFPFLSPFSNKAEGLLVYALPRADRHQFNPVGVFNPIYDSERAYPQTSQAGKFIPQYFSGLWFR